MTDQNLTPEAVERVASAMESQLRRIAGISGIKSLEANLLRALAQQTAALQAEVERLTKERDEARAQVVGAFEAAASVAWADRESGLTVNTKIRALTPDDAQAALRSMLADAERDMRQRAAKVCDRNDQVSGWVSRDAILALPLKYADREGGK